MTASRYDVAVVGAGPAGLAAAIAAREEGAGRVAVIDRDTTAGGILQQCIHPGFGLFLFKQEMTGPEYAHLFVQKAHDAGVAFLLDTTVLGITEGGDIACIRSGKGIDRMHAESIVLAMGCRERTRTAIRLPGTRPAGVYTAGAAQRLMNRQNLMVGKKIVILGSGDIGMIMARRMTLEGAEVVAVIELLDYLTGLTRNRVQCLDDFGIPLYLSHTITEIYGRERVAGVKVAKVDSQLKPLPQTEFEIPCDTLLLSVGLIPENELSSDAGIALSPVTRGPIVNQRMQTSVERIFACGNVVHVNDLVDNVSRESSLAGAAAARYAMGKLPPRERTVDVAVGNNVRYVCPFRIDLPAEAQEIPLFFRVSHPMRQIAVSVRSADREILRKQKKTVNPGEMESVSIKADAIDANTITISVDQEAK